MYRSCRFINDFSLFFVSGLYEDGIALSPCCVGSGKTWGTVPGVPFAQSAEETLNNFIALREKKIKEGSPCFEGIKCPYYIEDSWKPSDKIRHVSFSMYPSLCQSKCIYCEICIHNADNHRFNMEEHGPLYEKYFAVLDYALKQNMIAPDASWEVSSGEISIHPFKERILDYVKRQATCYFSNCFIYNERIAENLSVNPRASICFSIDAGTATTWRKVKGGNNFASTCDVLARYTQATQHPGQIGVKYIILPDVNTSVQDFEGAVKIMKRLGLTHIRIAGNLNLTKQQQEDKTLSAAARFYAKLEDNGFTVGYDAFGDDTIKQIKERAMKYKPKSASTKPTPPLNDSGDIDAGFAALMQKIAGKSESGVYNNMVSGFNKLPAHTKKGICDYFDKYPFWGKLDPVRKIYDVFHSRAKILKTRCENFIWLHERLADAQSKNVLFAILSNWVDMDFTSLDKYKENTYPEYYNPTIFPRRRDEVLVDVGAYTGDSAINFIKAYTSYKRIYCYEITPSVFETMEANLAALPNIVLRHRAAGSQPGTLRLSANEEASANRLSNRGEVEVEVVRIDDDIPEPVTFIKMDIEGAEQDALRGCARQIRENHPHLAICTYHGNEDIIAIPKLIEEIAPGYTFYMRHHGGNLVPTEFSLLAVWKQNQRSFP